jgi:hypothetical protein
MSHLDGDAYTSSERRREPERASLKLRHDAASGLRDLLGAGRSQVPSTHLIAFLPGRPSSRRALNSLP